MPEDSRDDAGFITYIGAHESFDFTQKVAVSGAFWAVIEGAEVGHLDHETTNLRSDFSISYPFAPEASRILRDNLPHFRGYEMLDEWISALKQDGEDDND